MPGTNDARGWHPRTLVVDNYDSYTYNLVALLTDAARAHYSSSIYDGGYCGGAETSMEEAERRAREHIIVIRNDEYSWATVRDSILPHVDNIVISPGPGTPARRADVGVGRDIIAHTEEDGRPVLGVCLGHQMIAHEFGAKVEQSVVPVHGQTSTIDVVDDSCLFRGIPNGFRAVRYHSLTVTRMSSNLRVLARASGTVEHAGRMVESTDVMGIRHNTLPLWGVQFHPESVCSEHGAQLLANFSHLTRMAMGRTHVLRIPPHVQSMSVQARDQRVWERKPTEPRFNLVARRVELQGAVDAGAKAFAHLHGDDWAPLWLDASDNSGMSVLASSARAATVRYSVHSQQVRVVRATGPNIEDELFVQALSEPFWTWMQRIVDDTQCVDSVGPAFRCGWIGHFAYEMKDDGCGDRGSANEVDAQLTFVDRCVVVEPGCAWVLALVQRTVDVEHEWLDQACGFTSTSEAEAWVHTQTQRVVKALDLDVPDPEPLHVQMRPLMDRATYLDAILAAQQLIAQGESYEICLTNEFRAAIDPGLSSARQAYMHMRQNNPAPFGAFIWDSHNQSGILSCSPERFQRTRVNSETEIEMKPIKGTSRREPRPLSSNEFDEWLVEDERRKHELLNSIKERAENLMIVDLIRHDLNTISHSVCVERLMHIESFARVHQMVTTVRARALSGMVECLAHCFPPGSMTGAPKTRTTQIISQLENRRRGVYSGVLGYFSVHGRSDWAVVIRTAVVADGRMSVGTGGALTILSDPKAEWAEVETKLHATMSDSVSP
ncbi:hypothetical protein IW147_001630 [Coemansia sp. RSA 720]|nr:hypothetical protein IW147_001630 [Coemansia sp. RSA 720]